MGQATPAVQIGLTSMQIVLMHWTPQVVNGNKLFLMIMIMTSGWGLQQRPTSPITKKIQHTKNKNGQWSSAKVTNEL